MNERIKELAVQAEEYSYKEYAKRETGYTREDFFTKKFAELIVRECAKVAFNDWCDGTNEGSSEQAILKHFGVAE